MPLDPQQQAMLVANLASIEGAISSGASSASYDGKSMSFRSLSEMRSIRDDLRRQLGLPTRSRRTVAGFRSGF
jgi:hypothetical protein